MSQDQTLWLKPVDKNALDYHEKQFKNPYRSTIAFSNWLKSLKLLSKKTPKKILDVGSGEGASLSFLAGGFPKSEFIGVDINKTLVKKGNLLFNKMGQKNCFLEVGDLYALNKKYKNVFDGVISLQTLSWLPEYKVPLKQIIKLNPSWIAISSLFYDGFVECEIKVKDYTNVRTPQEVFYNVYSLKLVENFLKKHGYKKFKYVPFIIDADVEKNSDGKMGTYTLKTEKGRIQISGPLLMNWYFIAAIRE